MWNRRTKLSENEAQKLIKLSKNKRLDHWLNMDPRQIVIKQILATNTSKELIPKIKVHNAYYSEEYGRKSTLKAESLPKLGSSGSMRKEKEWKRTFTCKLFEERHNVKVGEGMDSLWGDKRKRID